MKNIHELNQLSSSISIIPRESEHLHIDIHIALFPPKMTARQTSCSQIKSGVWTAVPVDDMYDMYLPKIQANIWHASRNMYAFPPPSRRRYDKT